jgi:protein involved in polysaccharide export with SLBB domain
VWTADPNKITAAVRRGHQALDSLLYYRSCLMIWRSRLFFPDSLGRQHRLQDRRVDMGLRRRSSRSRLICVNSWWKTGPGKVIAGGRPTYPICDPGWCMRGPRKVVGDAVRGAANGFRSSGHIMQRMGWLRLDQVRHGSLGRWSRLRLLRAALAGLPMIIPTACDATRSFERAVDGPVVYLDELSDAQKAAARDEIVRTLDRGLAVYALQIGDEFEVFFDVKRRPTEREYVISVGDKVSVDFLNDATNNTVVLVRPDGRISLPLIGPVAGAGKSADRLGRELTERYGAPITVNLTETHSPLEDFIEVVGPSGRPRSIVDKVLPDGTVSLPLLQPIQARGRTLDELQHEIDRAYAKLNFNITVSLVPRTLHPGTVMVLGEIAKPGRIDSDRPQTVLMSIAQAGGVLTTGSMEAVRVFYIGADQLPRMRSVNLKEEIEDLRLDEDMILPTNSVIYVPPTQLAKTGRFLDSVLRDILRFQGFSVGGTFLINNQNSGGTIVIPAP